MVEEQAVVAGPGPVKQEILTFMIERDQPMFVREMRETPAFKELRSLNAHLSQLEKTGHVTRTPEGRWILAKRATAAASSGEAA
jgi:predicted transcriptional regulator of viral defense system